MEISLLRQKALKELQRNLKINFSNLELLNQALTHSSKEPIFHNERLEFLGDAVLELVVTEYLFKEYPEKSEERRVGLSYALTSKLMAENLRQRKRIFTT